MKAKKDDMRSSGRMLIAVQKKLNQENCSSGLQKKRENGLKCLIAG